MSFRLLIAQAAMGTGVVLDRRTDAIVNGLAGLSVRAKASSESTDAARPQRALNTST